jgi:hypothetical protein
VSYFKLVFILILIIILFNLFFKFVVYEINFKIIKFRIKILTEKENADMIWLKSEKCIMLLACDMEEIDYNQTGKAPEAKGGIFLVKKAAFSPLHGPIRQRGRGGER